MRTPTTTAVSPSGTYKPHYALHDVQSDISALLAPQTACQPWPYVFRKGEQAWAMGGNGRWRKVTICDDGFLEFYDNRVHTVYTATWTREGLTLRGTFAPEEGFIKPDTNAVWSLLEEAVLSEESEGRWA